MFPGFERLDGLLPVIRNRRIDMHRMHVRIRQKILIGGISFFDTILVPHFIQLCAGALADGIHVGTGVALIDRDEFGPEPETDDGNVDS